MRQGNDVGTQYRSAIYAHTDAQRTAAEASRDAYARALAGAGYGPVTTEIRDAPDFYFAEDYHQQYLAKNPNGYDCATGTGVACPVGLGVEAPAGASSGSPMVYVDAPATEIDPSRGPEPAAVAPFGHLRPPVVPSDGPRPTRRDHGAADVS
jgi:hypothetical protein